ncbi:MAG: YdcF family protein, partial [Nonlabens sp.]|nr:YdcF family protein [Nonlabens sp.]
MNELDHAYVGIVLGASVRPDKSLSPILQDRVDAAFLAYENGIIERFLLSGDHGTTSYDEVNAMKNYLNDKGVPNDVIFLDHAGFDTYDTMYRARDVFKVKDAIVDRFRKKLDDPGLTRSAIGGGSPHMLSAKCCRASDRYLLGQPV